MLQVRQGYPAKILANRAQLQLPINQLNPSCQLSYSTSQLNKVQSRLSTTVANPALPKAPFCSLGSSPRRDTKKFPHKARISSFAPGSFPTSCVKQGPRKFQKGHELGRPKYSGHVNPAGFYSHRTFALNILGRFLFLERRCLFIYLSRES
jgi:hypothetical protein